MNAQGINPKVVADQQGHTVDVNQNIYTQTPLEIRREAVETLASALVNYFNWVELGNRRE